MKGKEVGVVEMSYHLGSGEDKRKKDGETFAKAVGEGIGTRIGKGKRKAKAKVRERLGEGKEALGRRRGMWCSWEESLVELGDRVVIVGKGGVEERDRGMIGEVIEVRKVEGEVVVEGLNMVSLRDLLLVVYKFLCEKELGVFRGFLKT